VFQSYALYPHMTVYGKHRLGLQDPKIPADEIKKLFQVAADTAGPHAFLDRKPKTLSGGQRRAWVWAAPSYAPVGVPVRRAAVQPGRRAARGTWRRAVQAAGAS